jgi:peptidoglycan/LPS O-acetylase OafA/YrhL
MKHIKEFDGLRGLLALWVFAAHALELGPWASWAGHVQPNLAVDVFIILSGFVIFHLLSTGEDYRTFITRRWFRLFPVFAVCFLFSLVLFAWLHVNDVVAFGIPYSPHVTGHLLAHATMLHGAVPAWLLPDAARAILVPAWSISLEWQFYLVAPLLFALAVRPNWKLGLVLVAIVGFRVFHDVAPAAVKPYLRFDMAAILPLRLEFFAVGVGSYGLWRWLSERERPLQIPPLCWALFLPVLLLVARRSPAVGLWLLLLVALILAQFGSRPEWFQRATAPLRLAPVQTLGKWSYCLYLLHLPMLVLTREVIRAAAPEMAGSALQLTLLGLGLVASLLGAWVLHRAVEWPMMQLGKRLTAGWNAKPAVAPASNATAWR